VHKEFTQRGSRRLSWRRLSWHRLTWHPLTWHPLTWHRLTWHRLTWRRLSVRRGRRASGMSDAGGPSVHPRRWCATARRPRRQIQPWVARMNVTLPGNPAPKPAARGQSRWTKSRETAHAFLDLYRIWYKSKFNDRDSPVKLQGAGPAPTGKGRQSCHEPGADKGRSDPEGRPVHPVAGVPQPDAVGADPALGGADERDVAGGSGTEARRDEVRHGGP